jgi:hypothetical protein
MAGRHSSDLQEVAGQGGFGVTADPRTLSWGDLLLRTYRLYRERFWAFFRMAFLPASLAYLFTQIWWIWVRPSLMSALTRLLPKGLTPIPARFRIEDLARFLKLGHAPWYNFFLNPGNVAGFLEGAVYWLLSAFLFAAVATNVLEDGESKARPLADAYSAARERLGPILIASLLAWTCYTISRLIGGFAVWKISVAFRLGTISASLLSVLPLVLICGLLSRVGLVIPRLIDHEEDSLASAIRTSIRQSEDWEPFFMLFVIKSAILGYALYWLARNGLEWLWQKGALSDALDLWVYRLVYISIAAALETPLFIAFSLLYRAKTKPNLGGGSSGGRGLGPDLSSSLFRVNFP